MRVMTRKHWRNGRLEFLRIPASGSTIRTSLSSISTEESATARRETFHRQLERMKEAQSANVIPWNRRNDFLYREAGHLHYLGLSEETLYAALKDIARRYCADGEEYVRQQDAKLRSIATRVSAMTYDR